MRTVRARTGTAGSARPRPRRTGPGWSGTSTTEPARPATRGDMVGAGLRWTAQWSGRVLLVALALALLGYVIGLLWVVVLPVFLALALATVLRPPAAWLIAHRWPPVAAALLVLLVAVAVLVGLAIVLGPPVIGQIGAMVAGVVGGLGQVRAWLAGPPLDLGSGQAGAILDMLTQQLQQSAATIASTTLTAVGTIASSIATLLLALVLAFLFVKDGSRVLPWVQHWAGTPAGPHLGEVLTRSWHTLGGFIRAQALVGLIDGALIGIGLAVIGVPLALPIAVLTFFAAFVPYIGAVVAGALAILIALFSQGFTSALVVLAIVLVVQQLEGNVLAPLLQGRTLGLHPAVILLAVVVGWSLYGVVGSLLAVPVTAVAATVLNYLREQALLRGGADREPVGGSPSGPEDGRSG